MGQHGGSVVSTRASQHEGPGLAFCVGFACLPCLYVHAQNKTGYDKDASTLHYFMTSAAPNIVRLN